MASQCNAWPASFDYRRHYGANIYRTKTASDSPQDNLTRLFRLFFGYLEFAISDTCGSLGARWEIREEVHIV